MKGKNVIIGAAAAFTLGGLLVYAYGKTKKKARTRILANEGYELAPDIHFPNKNLRNKKLKFGPVLPV